MPQDPQLDLFLPKLSCQESLVLFGDLEAFCAAVKSEGGFVSGMSIDRKRHGWVCLSWRPGNLRQQKSEESC